MIVPQENKWESQPEVQRILITLIVKRTLSSFPELLLEELCFKQKAASKLREQTCQMSSKQRSWKEKNVC